MAQVVYLGVQTASILSGMSNRLVFSSVELAVHAAATAVRALRPSGGDQKSVAENPLVREELESMDIEAKLKTVHALVLTIQKTRGGGGGKQQVEEVDDSDVIGVCLSQVKDVLESITGTLTALNTELDAHDQRWFSSWRTPDTKHYVLALKAKILILDKRVDMLLKVKSFVGGNGDQHHHHVVANI
jgi:hypothetical protein